MCKIMAICTAKGGCGKTTSAVNISAALVKEGYRVLMVDMDPQANATLAMGLRPESITNNIASMMRAEIENEDFGDFDDYIIIKEGIHILPSNLKLTAIEVSLVNAYSRESVLKSILDRQRDKFDFILLDCLCA